MHSYLFLSQLLTCVSWLVRTCHCSCWHLFPFFLLYSKWQMSLTWHPALNLRVSRNVLSSQRWALDGAVTLQKRHTCAPAELQGRYRARLLETLGLWRSKLAGAEITSTCASIKRIFCCSFSLGETSLRPSAGIFSSHACEPGLVMLVWKVKLHSLHNAQ